jgi:hypothetical protein
MVLLSEVIMMILGLRLRVLLRQNLHNHPLLFLRRSTNSSFETGLDKLPSFFRCSCTTSSTTGAEIKLPPRTRPQLLSVQIVLILSTSWR